MTETISGLSVDVELDDDGRRRGDVDAEEDVAVLLRRGEHRRIDIVNLTVEIVPGVVT